MHFFQPVQYPPLSLHHFIGKLSQDQALNLEIRQGGNGRGGLKKITPQLSRLTI